MPFGPCGGYCWISLPRSSWDSPCRYRSKRISATSFWKSCSRLFRTLRFDGIVVIVDRVDEPYLINGSADLMQALVWPMLDNKFLKHPGLGLKLLLPVELERRVDRQDRDFHERARLDKQNLIRSLAWTGQSLYDLANARLKACAVRGKAPDDHRPFGPGDRRAAA